MIDLLIKLGVPSQYAGDAGLLIVFVVVGMALIIFLKRRNLGGLLISIYIAFAITAKSYFVFLESFGVKVAYFIIVSFLIYTFFKRLFNLSIGGSKKVVVWSKTTVFSLAITGLIISIILSWYPSIRLQEVFSSFSIGLFISESAQLVWMVVPLAIVIVFKYRQ